MFEEEAMVNRSDASDIELAAISTAISLKRIADVVERIAGTDSEELCDFIEAVAKGLKIRDVD